jgi:hypothetical protein
MTDFRALCAELADELDAETGYTKNDGERIVHPTVALARIALTQPEPEGLTDEELLRAYGLAKRDHCYEGPIDDWPNRAERAATVHGLRAVIAADRARWGLPAVKPEGTITEPRGCPTPGACSCPTAPYVPPELILALELAEAALADIGDAERESGDDLAWAENRAAQDLPRIRAVLARWGSPPQ